MDELLDAAERAWWALDCVVSYVEKPWDMELQDLSAVHLATARDRLRRAIDAMPPPAPPRAEGDSWQAEQPTGRN